MKMLLAFTLLAVSAFGQPKAHHKKHHAHGVGLAVHAAKKVAVGAFHLVW